MKVPLETPGVLRTTGVYHTLTVTIIGLLLLLFMFISSSSAQDIESLKRGVVKIEATTFDEKRKIGTGFIARLEQDAVYIVTASHVVEGASEINVEFFTRRNRRIPAEVIHMEGGDPQGLAVLLVGETIPSGLSALKLTSSISVGGGESVTTIGFPRISGVPWAVIKGDIVGRKGKTITFDGAVDEGNSGGPLMTEGQVIGVVTEVTEKFAYAIPTLIAQYVLEGWGIKIEEGIPLPTTTPAPQPTATPTQLPTAIPTPLPTATPTPLPAATPTPLPTVSEAEQRITELLEKADVYFARQWYTTPEETNAFDVYLEVLKLDPTNKHALQQIERMAEFYKSGAKQAVQQGKTERAIQYYRRYLKIVPDDEEILDRVAELEELSSTMMWDSTKWDKSRWQ